MQVERTEKNKGEMQSSSSESEYTDINYESSHDDSLMVSFPSRPRKSNRTGRGSISSQSESSDTIRVSSKDGDVTVSQADSQSKNSIAQQAGPVTHGDSFKSIKGSKESPSLLILSENEEEIDAHADGARDVKSSISCSATSEETSLNHDTILTVQNTLSGSSDHDHSDSDSSDTSDEDSSSSCSSSESETTESEQSQSHSEVSTIPYPTAGTSTEFYGWGEISESDHSQDGSYYRSSNASSVKSNRTFHVGFSDRNRCDVSLTESQASRSVIEEEFIEDEYDPKRPWKKRPAELELDQISEKSFAMSALSGSESGSIFFDNGDCKSKAKEVGYLCDNQETSKGGKSVYLDTKSEESGESVKSTRSSLNSDLSVLKVAKEALRKGSVSLSEVPRRTSESKFTLTTQAQSMTKHEPFRPGPTLTNSTTHATQEILHTEANKPLGISVQRPQARPARSKHRAFPKMGLMVDSSLPSINENGDSLFDNDLMNKLQSEVTPDSDLNVADFRARAASSPLASIEEGEDEAVDLNSSRLPAHLDTKNLSPEQPSAEDSARYIFQDGSGNSLDHEGSCTDLDLDLDLEVDLSVADSSDDEDEFRPMARRTSLSLGLQQARHGLSTRRIRRSNRSALCCRKMRQSCGRCKYMSKRTLFLAAATITILVVSLVMVLVYTIPQDQELNKDLPSKLIESISPSPQPSSPSSQPSTKVFTLWPTPLDTYTQKYTQNVGTES